MSVGQPTSLEQRKGATIQHVRRAYHPQLAYLGSDSDPIGMHGMSLRDAEANGATHLFFARWYQFWSCQLPALAVI